MPETLEPPTNRWTETKMCKDMTALHSCSISLEYLIEEMSGVGAARSKETESRPVVLGMVKGSGVISKPRIDSSSEK